MEDYESQAGIDLSEYVSYRFYYDSDGLKIEGYFSAPKDLLDGQKTSCLIYNHGGNQDYRSIGKYRKPAFMPISFIPFALHQTTGDVEAVKEKTSLAEQMWMMWSGYWICVSNFPILIRMP